MSEPGGIASRQFECVRGFAAPRCALSRARRLTVSLSRFKKSRARLQRFSDAKIFRGWIETLNQGTACVEFADKSSLAAGDQFHVEAHGPGKIATFTARVALVSDSSVILEIEGPVRFAEPTEDSRFRIDGLTAKIGVQDRRFDAEVLDVSAKGIGLSTSAPFGKGDPVAIELATRFGAIQGAGEVRYCRALEAGALRFRIGVLWVEMSRVDQGRWMRILDEEAA